MDPKYLVGIYQFPFGEDTPLKEPVCGSLLMSSTRNVVIGGWVRWREPFIYVVPRLGACGMYEPPQSEQTRLGDDERLIWSTSSAVCCMTAFASFPSSCTTVKCFILQSDQR